MPYISDNSLTTLRIIANFTLDGELIPDDEDSERAGEEYEMTIDDAFSSVCGAVTGVREVVKAIDEA